MLFSNKKNQSIIYGRDYRAVPGDETQSLACAATADNSCLSPNTTPKSDYESSVASERALIEEEKRTRRGRRLKARRHNSAIPCATVERLAKVAEAEADAEHQLLRVSAVSFIGDVGAGQPFLDTDTAAIRNNNEKLQINLESCIWKRPGFESGAGDGSGNCEPLAFRRSSNRKSIRSQSSYTQRFVASMWSRSVCRKRAKNFIPILLLVAYSASGGLMFWLLEGRGRQAKADQERAQRELKQYQLRNETIGRLVDLIGRSHQEHVAERMEVYDTSTLDDYARICAHRISAAFDSNPRCFVDSVIEALNDTFSFQDVWSLDEILSNFSRTVRPLLKEHDRRDWTFWGSLFYCGTIYTTIGYGYMTANTDAGRAMTIAYALLGIPLVLYNLSQLGGWLMRAIWTCYVGALKLINACRPARYRCPKEKEREREMAEFPFWIAISITMAWTLMCSALFRLLEDWDFFTSFYFFFQSLTTIGFGDVKPNHPEYLVWSFLLILIGLALVSMCWSLLQMKFDRLITAATKKIAEQFVNTELEDSQMTLDIPSIESEIERITTGENVLLANLVSENRWEALVNEWRKKAKMKNTACQTEIRLEDKSIQIACSIKEIASQTPSLVMSPSISAHWDVPYRETRRATMCSSATTTPRRDVSNDEFRNLLQSLKTVIGECRETLSNKELTSGIATVTHPLTLTPVNRGRGSGKVRYTRSRSISRASTAGSMSMLEL